MLSVVKEQCPALLWDWLSAAEHTQHLFGNRDVDNVLEALISDRRGHTQITIELCDQGLGRGSPRLSGEDNAFITKQMNAIKSLPKCSEILSHQ